MSPAAGRAAGLALLLLSACTEPPPLQAALLPSGEVLAWRGGRPDSPCDTPRPGSVEVRVVRDGSPGGPMLGRAFGCRHHARFTPQSPPEAGLTLSVAALDGTAPLRVPAPPALPPPSIAQVWPSGASWPANTLRMHLAFDQPMRTARPPRDALELVDDTTGEVVPGAFRDLPLWTTDHRRLTVLFHPGRQKTGIPFGAELGPVLLEGHRYTLRVQPTIARSRAGQPLEAPVEVSFTAGPRVTQAGEPEAWTLRPAPAAGSREPIVLDLDVPLDGGSLERSFRVERDEIVIPTRCAPRDQERAVACVPDAAWTPGPYALVAWEPPEDAAGNTPRKPFEARPGTPRDRGEAGSWSFSVE